MAMNDDEPSNLDQWIDARLSALREPAAFQPDASRAGVRLDERRFAARRSRRLWTVAGIVAALLASLTLPWPRATAQRLWDRLTVRRVEIVQVSRKDLPSTIMRAFELNDVRRDKPIAVHDADEAERVAGFHVHLASASVLHETPQLEVVKTEVEETPPVKTADLRQALATAGVFDLEVPNAWEGARVRVEGGPAVTAGYKQAQVYITESSSFKLTTPPGFPVGRFMEMAFRIVGRSPAEARNFGAQFPTNPAWLLVFPGHDTVEEVPLRSGRAILAGGEGGMCFFWNTPDRIYVLGAVKANRDLATAIANSINAQP
jgi:hypothetical protein